MRVSRAVFETLVRRALESIPEALAHYLDNVIVEVEDLPDAAACRELEVDDPHDLLGAYLGTPMTQRSVESAGLLPDRIVIYQSNLERMCRTREELIEEIRLTVLHEVGHHFGMDEDDLDGMGYG